MAALGLWGGLAARAQPIEAIRISDGRPGEGAARLFLHFDGQEIDEGPMGHILEDRYLRPALLAAMEAEPLVSHRPSSPVVGQEVDAGRGEVTLADGAAVRGALLVGCDGRDSQVARRAGIRRRGWDYGQTSLVAAVAHERPHRGTAHQFFMPSGPLAILPLPGRPLVDRLDRGSRPRRGDRGAGRGRLSRRAPAAVRRLPRRHPAGRARATAIRWACRWPSASSAPRLALAGDAAHGIHPLAGQGLNLGLRDVAALAEVLVAAARRGQDIGAADVLAAYARWRRSRHRGAGGGDRRAEPALFQRQSAAAARSRPRARRGQPAARRCAAR